MERQWEKTQGYLEHVTGGSHPLGHWSDAAELPAYLRAEREFRTTSILGRDVLLTATTDVGAKQLHRLAGALGGIWGGPVVFVLPMMHPQTRARLTDAGVSFVVPWAYLYLPQLLVTHQSRARISPVPANSGRPLTPAAQAVLLSLLIRPTDAAPSVSEMAAALQVANMTVSRAVTQLVEAELITIFKAGKRREVALAGPRGGVWTRALPLLSSPVHDIVWVAGDIPAELEVLEAGDTAISRYSDLAAPRVPEYAVSWRKDLQGLHWVEGRSEAGFQLQLWRYDPRSLAEGATVDRLSLYLALRNERDPRMQAALDQMMGAIGWLEG